MRNLDQLFQNTDLDAEIGPWGKAAAYQAADFCLDGYETLGIVDTQQQRLILAVSNQPEHGHFEMELISFAAEILNNEPIAYSPCQARYYTETLDTEDGLMVFVCDATPPRGMVNFLLRAPVGCVGFLRGDVIEAAAKIAAGLNDANYIYYDYHDRRRFTPEERQEIDDTNTIECPNPAVPALPQSSEWESL